MIDYTKYLKPIGVSGFVCVDCGKSLSTCDRYCECPDCGAIFCEDCVINYVLNNHICEYDDMEPYLDDKDFIQNESDTLQMYHTVHQKKAGRSMTSPLLSHDLFEAEKKHILAIRTISDFDIVTDDFDEDRIINYHIAPVTKDWLKDRFIWCDGTSDMQQTYETRLIDLLYKIDHKMLITLNKIIIIKDETSISYVCDYIKADEDEWPSVIDFDTNDILGCHWWSQSCVIINISAIAKTLAEMQKEYDHDELYFDEPQEEWIGIATTLLHEIRHLGLFNPFLDMTAYPTSAESESEVEAWALEQFERL